MTDCVAWVLNVDAELELIDPAYRRSDRMRAHVDRLARRIVPWIAAATGTRPVVLGDEPTRAPGCARGDAWCPTPRALARLRAAGVAPPDSPPDSPPGAPPDVPPVDVLRRVNHRAFAAALGPRLPGACFATDVDAVHAALARAPAHPWLLKRPLGFSGRMRKVVVPDALDAAAATWIAASIDGYGGGLMVEPLVERLVDVSLHGRVERGGAVRRGVPVIVTCAAAGAFVGARRAAPADLGRAEVDALHDAGDRVAAALVAHGYVGPFGIDAFRWRAADGDVAFHPLSELNARYTMAWWTGMGGA